MTALELSKALNRSSKDIAPYVGTYFWVTIKYKNPDSKGIYHLQGQSRKGRRNLLVIRNILSEFIFAYLCAWSWEEIEDLRIFSECAKMESKCAKRFPPWNPNYKIQKNAFYSFSNSILYEFFFRKSLLMVLLLIHTIPIFQIYISIQSSVHGTYIRG